MSQYNSQIDERRLSINGRNAYLVVSSENINKQKNIFDPEFNKNYLSLKPIVRARSCSPTLQTLEKHNSAPKISDNNQEQLVQTTKKSNLLSYDQIYTQTTNTPIHSATAVTAASTQLIEENRCGINTVETVCSIAGTPIATLPEQISSNPMMVNVPRDNSTPPKSSTQTGINRYFTVVKRKRSPKSSKISSSSKMTREDQSASKTQNRFAILASEIDEPAKEGKFSRPPPLYLREQNSEKVVKELIALIGEKSFYVVPLKRGQISEIKIQVHSVSDYRLVSSDFEKKGKSFYTYQLKSSKGLKVVLKGIDSCVDPSEIKNALENSGFKVKNVTNILNRNKIPQPLFRVELEPGDITLKKNEIHPIYNLRYLLHRRITVEEPHKRNGPTQCLNCQEFGHTKAYCKLPTVCVVCGDLHNSSECDKSRDDSTSKKCSNCGGNHTANYRGCPVYSFVKRSTQFKATVPPVYSHNIQTPNLVQSRPVSGVPSYSSILKSGNRPNSTTNTHSQPPNPSLHDKRIEDVPPIQNYSRLEATIDTLVQTINNFTNSMNNMMQEMIRMQSTLLQAVLNKP